MAYLGNRNATGENNSFKILDDLAFTTTFNGSDGNVVNHVADTITINNHRFLTGSRVTYTEWWWWKYHRTCNRHSIFCN